MGSEVHDEYIMTGIDRCEDCGGVSWSRYDFKYRGRRGHCNKCHKDWPEE